MEFVNHALQNITNFSGRTRREHFWKFLGLVFVVNIILALIMPVDFGLITGTLGFVLNIVTFFLTLSLSVRRLHDTGRSGWWLLIGLIPFVGFIVLIYFYVQDSDRLPNEYGPSPKYNNEEFESFQDESSMYRQNPEY